MRKIFNRNNVKVSYSCTENIGSIISSHNKKSSTNAKTWSISLQLLQKIRLPTSRWLPNYFLHLQMRRHRPEPTEESIHWSHRKKLKQRISGHKTSIKNAKYRNSMTMSTYIWNVKDQTHCPNTQLVNNETHDSILKHKQILSSLFTREIRNPPLWNF